MKIEIDESTVKKDGEPVGNVGNEGEFVPYSGLHHKTVQAIERYMENMGKNDPELKVTASTYEPAKDSELGDLTPALINWRFENWATADFDELYPAIRLRAIPYVLPS
jgi:hypothetical protein